MAHANQQKQFDEINRAAILSRIQAARPVQQMGMVSFTLSLMLYRWSLVLAAHLATSQNRTSTLWPFQIYYFLPILDVRCQTFRIQITFKKHSLKFGGRLEKKNL